MGNKMSELKCSLLKWFHWKENEETAKVFQSHLYSSVEFTIYLFHLSGAEFRTRPGENQDPNLLATKVERQTASAFQIEQYYFFSWTILDVSFNLRSGPGCTEWSWRYYSFWNFRFSLKRSLENWMVMVLWFTEREIELYYLFEFEALLMRLH